VCNDIKLIREARERAFAAAAAAPPCRDGSTWGRFLEQATWQNVAKLRYDEIGMWNVCKEGDKLVVTIVGGFVDPDRDSPVLARGPCPSDAETLCKVLLAIMIMPADATPQRPKTIMLDVPAVNEEAGYRYVFSEMLRIRVYCYRDGNAEDRNEMLSCAAFPIRRVGRYRKGEACFEPPINLRIYEQRRHCFEKMGFGTTEDNFKHVEGMDVEGCLERKPRWEVEGYETLEECIAAEGEDDLEHWSEIVHGWGLESG